MSLTESLKHEYLLGSWGVLIGEMFDLEVSINFCASFDEVANP
jgi:hypothetical protein